MPWAVTISVSLARKDISGLCEAIVESILRDLRENIDRIAHFLNIVLYIRIGGRFILLDVSRYVKRNGRKRYLYYFAKGTTTFISKGDTNTKEYI
jgi:hypothetical protein